MRTIIVSPKSKLEQETLLAFLSQSGISYKFFELPLSDEELEDAGLLILMQEADRADSISLAELKNTIEKRLQSKANR